MTNMVHGSQPEGRGPHVTTRALRPKNPALGPTHATTTTTPHRGGYGPTKLTRLPILVLVGVVAVYAAAVLWPLTITFNESIKVFVPGQVGSTQDAPYTLDNYYDLLRPGYVRYFIDTFFMGAVASVIGLLFAYPMAYIVARTESRLARKLLLGFLVSLLFLSVLVRVYSIELTFGSAGFLKVLAPAFGIRPGSRPYIEFMVVLGLLHYVIPISALTLVGTLQNINPRLVQAAQTLGAPCWRAHLKITVPLSARGIQSAFLLSYLLCISAFVIPMILGKGRISFVSNLIYNRFGEVANYPSGSAIAIVMLLITLFIAYLVSRSSRGSTV